MNSGLNNLLGLTETIPSTVEATEKVSTSSK